MTPALQFDPAAWQPDIAMVRFNLANGLTLFVLPDHRLPIVSLQIHYKVGSRHELPGITGISHLFEHLMFRGTETLGPEEFSRILQAKGGEINAFTTKDHTSYFENLPAADLELGLQLEADRLLHLKLDDDTFQPERQVVISERKLRSVDSPFGLLEEQLFASAYTQHPYNWPVVGWDQDLHRMTLDDCLAYYRSHYHPGKITIVIAGDVEPEKARGLVDHYFGQIPAPAAAPESVVVEPPQRGERRAVLKKVSQVEALFAGYHIVGIDHPDLYPLSLLATILSGGRASRFHQDFVRPGKAIALDVELAPLPFSAQDPDLMVIAVVAAPGHSLPDLEQELWGALERLQQDGVTPAELGRAKKLVRAQAVRSLAHNFFRGLLVGLFHLKTGDATLANRILSSVDAVTAADILRVARTYLKEDNRTVVVLKPVTPEESEALGTLQ
ncbi:MAG: insulinase family protein [Syntrophobacterales bacterium]|jgi:zinc protease|nr:insulinase family protein [Syntrophobacterales bacterium]